MIFLKKVWRGWLKIGLIIGNFMINVLLTVFYFIVFPFFAVPFILFGKKHLRTQSGNSNWLIKVKTPVVLQDFEGES